MSNLKARRTGDTIEILDGDRVLTFMDEADAKWLVIELEGAIYEDPEEDEDAEETEATVMRVQLCRSYDLYRVDNFDQFGFCCRKTGHKHSHAARFAALGNNRIELDTHRAQKEFYE